MSQNICTLSARFAIQGQDVFPGTAFQVDIIFTDPGLTAADVLACEWYLDGVQVDSVNGLQLKGQGYCGDHIVAARILTEPGWSGLKNFAFANCRSINRTILEVEAGVKITDNVPQMNEGDTLRFFAVNVFEDGTKFDVSDAYNFSALDGGSFEGNTFHAKYSDSLVGSQMVTIEAVPKAGGTTLSQQVNVINIDQPVVPIADFDYMLVQYSWQDGASGGLDVAVGLENTDSDLNNQYVGYSQSGDRIPAAAAAQNAYLYWTNDGITDTGMETVLINLKQFNADFEASAIMGDFTGLDFAAADFFVDDKKNIGEVGLYAIWRGQTTASGLFKIRVKAFKGGSMQLQGATWTSVGGTTVYDHSYTLSTQLANSTLLADYYRLGKLRFNKKTNRSTLYLYDGSTN